MILENSKLVFFFFVLLAFVLPQFAGSLQQLLIPMLIVMMTLSVKDVTLGHLGKDNAKTVLKLAAVNYLVLTPSILLFAVLFIKDPAYLAGFIILASVPPAISIIPLVRLYHGDLRDSILGEIACYVLALGLSPVLVYLFLGESVDMLYYMRVLFLLIVVPLVLGRLIHGWRFQQGAAVVNIVYGFSLYIFIGLNRQLFIEHAAELLPVLLVVLIITFGLGYAIFLVLRQVGAGARKQIMYVLFGTFKNGNGAATLALLFFGPAAAVPVAVKGLVTPFYFAFLEKILRT